MIYQNILETIGNTPLVKINRMNKNKNVKIYVKLEGQNPAGSIKDRIALKMIEEAEKTGELNHEKTILEATSGNTGIGLALAASIKAFRNYHELFLKIEETLEKSDKKEIFDKVVERMLRKKK